MKNKSDYKRKERFTRETEASIDKEFAEVGIKTLNICHLRAAKKPVAHTPGTPCAITIVSEHAIEYDVVVRLAQDIESNWMCTQQRDHLGHYMLSRMASNGYPGVAICSCGDNFNRRDGRVRAKNRLKTHLLETGKFHAVSTSEPEGKRELDYRPAIVRLQLLNAELQQTVANYRSGATVRRIAKMAYDRKNEILVRGTILDRLRNELDAQRKANENDATRIESLRTGVADRDELITEQSEHIDRLRIWAERAQRTAENQAECLEKIQAAVEQQRKYSCCTILDNISEILRNAREGVQ